MCVMKFTKSVIRPVNITRETTALFRGTRTTLFTQQKAYEKQQQEIHDLEEFIAKT